MNQGYYDELARRLKKAGFSPQTVDSEGFMPVEWQGRPLCRATPSGGVSYKANDIKDGAFEAARDQVYAITKEVAHIQTLMEKAPTIKAQGLEGDYRALGEFNSVVLAGHRNSYGMEFVTWEWVQNHTSLWQGHYYGDDFAAAQRDFLTRSGLAPQNLMFSDAQLLEVRSALKEVLETSESLTVQKQETLKDVAWRIGDYFSEKERQTQLMAGQQQTGNGIQGMEMGGF